MLALLPLLGVSSAQEVTTGRWNGMLTAILVIGGIIFAGRTFIRPLFRLIASTRVREISTAFSLLLIIGISLLTQFANLSMALGAFISGVLLAESEYRHELESNIEPFKGLLLGLFFLSVGMSMNFGLFMEKPLIILMLVFLLVLVKAGVLFGIGKIFALPLHDNVIFALFFSQGGEFAFVLFNIATTHSILSKEDSSLLTVVVALSMVTTSLLALVFDKFLESRFASKNDREPDKIENEHSPVIVAGAGRVGQIAARLLHLNGHLTTIIDFDPQLLERTRKFGFKTFFGDASELDLLHAAGTAEAKFFWLQSTIARRHSK